MNVNADTFTRAGKKTRDAVMGRAKKLATKPKPKPIGSFAGFGTKRPGTTGWSSRASKGAWIVWVPTID